MDRNLFHSIFQVCSPETLNLLDPISGEDCCYQKPFMDINATNFIPLRFHIIPVLM